MIIIIMRMRMMKRYDDENFDGDNDDKYDDDYEAEK